MDKWMMATVAALGLGLGGCATDPGAGGMRYENGSYYAPARDGYGDYYVAPEPIADPWGDPFFDPFYGPYNDPFWFGPGWSGAYCSARYRYCPAWYDPWLGPGYGNWGYGSGFSITFGSGWGHGGWSDPWRRGPGGWGSPHHRRRESGDASTDDASTDDSDAAPGARHWPSASAYTDDPDAGDADRGDVLRGRPQPRPARRRAAPDPTLGGWPTAGAPRRPESRQGGGDPDGGRRNDAGGRHDGGGRAEGGGRSEGSSEGASADRRGRRDRTDP